MSFEKLNSNFKPAFDGPVEAQLLIDKIIKEYPLVSAYLFGSAAEGKNTVNSDLDILLVVPNTSDIKLYHKFVGQAYFSKYATDWIIKTENEFTQQSQLGGVSFIALNTGIKLNTNGSK